MQLLEVVIYSHQGNKRSVSFRTGSLNIVTGDSRTGKSALLAIVEYCLGRSTPQTPNSPAFDTVSWFGCLWEMPSGARVFCGRPSPSSASASSSRAMVELGGTDLKTPDFEDLSFNADRDSLRRVLGEQLGMRNVQVDTFARDPYAITIGSGALFCFQAQDEVASRTLLFHRQGEPQMAQVIKDTLPYYLGAVRGDEARKRRQLRTARQVLRRLEGDLAAAVREAEEAGSVLRSLLVEAAATGLTAVASSADLLAVVEILSQVRLRRLAQPDPASDIKSQDERRRLERERRDLQDKLTSIMRDRDALLDHTASEQEYGSAVRLQAGRMTSLELLPVGHGSQDAATCPLCGSEVGLHTTLTESLSVGLESLRQELVHLVSSAPQATKALADLDDEAREIRGSLDQLDNALDSLDSGSRIAGNASLAEQRDFVRGRIDATLERYASASDENLSALQRQRDDAEELVARLEDEVDSDKPREQLVSRLIRVGRDMTRFSADLELEHSDSVRLDPSALTVVADTDNGPIPLQGIGSAANWIGYHLVAHLALHKFFVRQNRPVPHFLMVDQPTQAYYQPDSTTDDAKSMADTDRDAVVRMFALMRDVVSDLTPQFQIIVIDHANLAEEWFAESVVHNWRGEKLIPEDWLDTSAG